MEFLQTISDIVGAILIFLKPIVIPIGEWMVSWITVVMSFLETSFGKSLTIFIIIGVVIVLSGIIINIVWPGDIKGTIFSKGKIDEFEDKIEEEEDFVENIKRCKDCGNPIGDADICSLCGARN